MQNGFKSDETALLFLNIKWSHRKPFLMPLFSLPVTPLRGDRRDGTGQAAASFSAVCFGFVLAFCYFLSAAPFLRASTDNTAYGTAC